MQLPTRWERALKDGFTKVWARLVYKSDVRKDTVDSWSGEREAYWVDSESDARGQATPIGTIILNERLLSGSTDEELMQVVEHEVGHLVRSPVARGVFYGLVFWISLGSLYLLKALGYSLLIPFGLPVGPVMELGGVSLLMMGLGFAAIRVEEIYADFHVLKYVTYDEYLTTYEEMREEDPRSLLSKIQLKLFYTDPKTIVRLHQTLVQMRNRMFVI